MSAKTPDWWLRNSPWWAGHALRLLRQHVTQFAPDMSRQETPHSSGRDLSPSRVWREILGSGLVLSVIFYLSAHAGIEPAARGERVLAGLNGWMQAAGGWGGALTVWTLEHLREVLQGLAAVTVTIVAVSLVSDRKRSFPLLLVGSAVMLAAAGESFLLWDNLHRGVLLLGGAILIGLILGVVFPIPAGLVPDGSRPGVDAVLALLLSCIGLATRMWALAELPSVFIGEMSEAMLASRTLAGMGHFAPNALLGTSIGFVHMFVQMAFFQIFGTSFYTLRLAAVAMGVAAIFAMYWFLRSLGGRRTAVLGTLILIAAPEQLWWSRSENTNFIAVPLMGILSAWLGLWLYRTLSWRSALAMSFWLPFGRFFYLAAVTMVTYPWLLVGHAAVFRRAGLRQLFTVVPILAVGTVFWVLSLSIVNVMLGGPARFLNPASHGEMVSRRSVEGRTAGLIEMARLQTESLAHNLTEVAGALGYKGGYSQWYERNDKLRRSTWMNVALAVIIAVSLAYLLGQLHRPEPAVLLAWLLVGLLPAVLSTAPDARRMAAAFPAMYAIAAYGIDGLLRAVRAGCNRTSAALSTLALYTGMVAILWGSLASHLQLRTALPPVAIAHQKTADLFRKSDAIYYDFDAATMLLLALANSDTILRRPPCIQFVGPREWLRTALLQPCSFDDATLRIPLDNDRLDHLRQQYQPPRTATFLLSQSFRSKPALQLLKEIFPKVKVIPLATSDEGSSVTIITVPWEMMMARRTAVLEIPPGVEAPAGVENSLLGNTSLRTVVRDGEEHPRIVGGLMIDDEEWYSVRLSPACAGAGIRLDGQPVQDELDARPLLSGIHRVEVQLPDLQRCPTPIRIEILARQSKESSWTPAVIVAPEVADLPAAQPPPSAEYAGYEDAGALMDVRGEVVSMRANPEGGVVLLTRSSEEYFIQTFDEDPTPVSTRQLPIPPGVAVDNLVVGPSGQILVSSDTGLWWFDGAGRIMAHWATSPLGRGASAFVQDGRLVTAIPEHAAVEGFRLEGSVEKSFVKFSGTPGFFSEPVSVALSSEGDLAVAQTNGDVLLFRTPLDRLDPKFAGRFHINFTFGSVMPRSLTFDGPDRILAGDPERLRVFVYDNKGVRLLAGDPTRDWQSITKELGEIRFLAATPRYFYALGSGRVPRRYVR